jgi:FtsZ-binding cell division protein ZapB
MPNILNSANFWFTFISSVFLVFGGVLGIVKGYNRLVADRITKTHDADIRAAEIEFIKESNNQLRQEIKEIRKDITPNGKNTQRLGDIAARSEEKIDNLMTFMERYAEKVDKLEQDFSQHIGYHRGADL